MRTYTFEKKLSILAFLAYNFATLDKIQILHQARKQNLHNKARIFWVDVSGAFLGVCVVMVDSADQGSIANLNDKHIKRNFKKHQIFSDINREIKHFKPIDFLSYESKK